MLIPFTQVDAFASVPHKGNPAAVMQLDAWLPDETLQAIAAENNLSETAFTVPAGEANEDQADYELRWFTPTAEVNMCGHATLASGHVLLARDVLLKRDSIRFRTRKAGTLIVARAGNALTLDLPATRVAPAVDSALLAILGTPAAEMFLSYHGTEQTAVVLLPDADAVRACSPDMKALTAIDLMVIVTAPGEDTDIVSRVFVPAWGVDEDPVTGAAHSSLTPFWCDRLGVHMLTAFQASKRGGYLTCRLAPASARDSDRVVLGGSCVTVIEGTYRL